MRIDNYRACSGSHPPLSPLGPHQACLTCRVEGPRQRVEARFKPIDPYSLPER